MSPSWITDSRVERTPSPSRSIQAIAGARSAPGRSTVLCPTHGSGARDLVDPDGAGGVAEVGLGAGGEQPTEHLVGGPLHGGDGGDAEPLVDLGAARVVDPGHDGLDAEGLPGHPRGDDVGVVAAADRGERVGPLDAGLGQHVLVEAVAGDLGAVEHRSQPPERVGVAVDDADGVVAVLEAARQRRADAPASHDHDVHGRNVTGERHLRGRHAHRARRPPSRRLRDALRRPGCVVVGRRDSVPSPPSALPGLPHDNARNDARADAML